MRELSLSRSACQARERPRSPSPQSGPKDKSKHSWTQKPGCAECEQCVYSLLRHIYNKVCAEWGQRSVRPLLS